MPIGATFESKSVKQLFKNYKRFEYTVMQLSYFIFWIHFSHNMKSHSVLRFKEIKDDKQLILFMMSLKPKLSQALS